MLRQSIDELDTKGQKGDWCFTTDDQYLILRWGDTLFETAIIAIGSAQDQKHWKWDGNREKPTIEPSIRVFSRDKTLWHGWLRSGNLVED